MNILIYIAADTLYSVKLYQALGFDTYAFADNNKPLESSDFMNVNYMDLLLGGNPDNGEVLSKV